MQIHPPTGSTRSPERVRDVVKPISGAAVGNMLEWFDYSLYGYLSATLAKVFFPSSDPIVSLIAAFAAFSVRSLPDHLARYSLDRLETGLDGAIRSP